MKVRVDPFLFGLALAVALAWVAPGPGAHGGSLHPELANKLGVALIFFLHGLTLSPAALRAGTLRWPLHVVVQGATFLLFPLLGWALVEVLGAAVPPDLRLGLFYLCALPSTVSSSVALTATARGNVPAAVFNATLSSLLGVLLTPLWIELVTRTSGAPLPLGKVIVDLLEWLVLPLAVGQVLRPLLGSLAHKHRRVIHLLDRFTILLLVYTSFCDSVQEGIFGAQALTPLVITVGACAVLLASLIALTTLVSRFLTFSAEDRVAAIFCGSKKTLASGVPMARLMFGVHPGMSQILLPIMIYHPLQLVVCGWLAARWGERAARLEGAARLG